MSEELFKTLDKKILDEKFEKLEKDIDNYCGDYGTLEGRLETTLLRILVIIKRISGGIIDE